MRFANVIDSTLREGMQSESGTFSLDQSVEIAKLLSSSGVVDTIECGHPQISEKEQKRVAAVVKASAGIPVLTHARLRRSDIEQAASTGAEWVGVFLGVNNLSAKYRTGLLSYSETIRQIETVLPVAQKLGLKVRFTIEDATRTQWEQIKTAVDAALGFGASRICFADSVGIAEPAQIATLFRTFKDYWPEVETEAHFHDDRGLAMANALAAVDSGVDYISTSVNSLGERAGITDLATFVVNQHLRTGKELPSPGALAELSRRVGAYSRSFPDDRRPIVGNNIFRHSSRLHMRAVEAKPETYEFINPELLGLKRKLGKDPVSRKIDDLIVIPPIISATELRHHRHGPGDRYVLVDNRMVSSANQYCIARKIPDGEHPPTGHVDPHTHHCDSLFVFLGDSQGFSGLTVEVLVGNETRVVHSPASVFIPAGEVHAYRPMKGGGTYINYVLSGDYNSSLLEKFEPGKEE